MVIATMNEERTMNATQPQCPPDSPARRSSRARRAKQRGFTLIELIVVVTIVGILAGVAVVQVKYAQRKAREAALMDNLHTMRKAIDNFYADKQRYPGSLAELQPNYIRSIPKDPMTGEANWEEIMDDPMSQTGENGEFMSSETDPQAMSEPGVVDVKSVAEGVTLGGTPYRDL
jgi:general secretion pathway protein G